MKKLITIGCSQTHYCWPTWADILGKSFDELYNWGHSGIGNRAVFERTIEAVLCNNPSENDLVIVQWSEPYRFDNHRLNQNSNSNWVANGNITNWPEWVYEHLFCEFSSIYHTCNYIIACKNFLENKKINFIFMSMNDILPLIDQYQDLSFYKDEIKSVKWLPPIFEWFKEQNLPNKKLNKKHVSYTKTSDGTYFPIVNDYVIDEHPTPYSQYLYLKSFLGKYFEINLNEQWAKHADKIVWESNDYKEILTRLEKELGWIENCEFIKGL